MSIPIKVLRDDTPVGEWSLTASEDSTHDPNAIRERLLGLARKSVEDSTIYSFEFSDRLHDSGNVRVYELKMFKFDVIFESKSSKIQHTDYRWMH